jgi:lysophospholipase L1-like esterase
VLVHAALIVALFRHDLVQRLEQAVVGTPVIFDRYQGMVAAHQAQNPEGCIVFIGDSIVQGLDVKAVTDQPALNFGIGGDNTVGARWRVPQYRSLKSARAIVLAIGVNDLWRLDDDQLVANYEAVLDLFPSQVPIIVSCILPVNEPLCERPHISYVTRRKAENARIRNVNQRLSQLAQRSSHLSVVDASSVMCDEGGNLRRDYTGDGIHLTAEGYDAWAGRLRQHLVAVLGAGAAK